MEPLWFLVPLFFLTALVYSTAGFGGGSTYLALLALTSVRFSVVPKIALVCNLVVVAGGCYHFYRHFSAKLLLPFVLTSVPLAYWGGTVPIGRELFQLLVGLSLLIASVRLFLPERGSHRIDVSWGGAFRVGIPVGGLLGGISGLVGIGGGIFLSPLLIILGWASSKQAAAASSYFILLNSLAGLWGQITQSGFLPDLPFLLPLAASVFLGGQIGSRWGSRRFSYRSVQKLTALLLVAVALRLLAGLVTRIF